MKKLIILAALAIGLVPAARSATLGAPEGAVVGASPLPRAMFAPVGAEWTKTLQYAAAEVAPAGGALHPIVADLQTYDAIGTNKSVMEAGAAQPFAPLLFHISSLYTPNQIIGMSPTRLTAAFNTAAKVAEKQINDRAAFLAKSAAGLEAAEGMQVSQLGRDLSEIRSLQGYGLYLSGESKTSLKAASASIRKKISQITDGKLAAMLAQDMKDPAFGASIKDSAAQRAGTIGASAEHADEYKALMEGIAHADDVENGDSSALQAGIPALGASLAAAQSEELHSLAAVALSGRLQKSTRLEDRKAARQALVEVGLQTPFATTRAIAINGVLSKLPSKTKAQNGVLEQVKAIAVEAQSATLVQWTLAQLQGFLDNQNPIQGLIKQLGNSEAKSSAPAAPAAKPADAPKDETAAKDAASEAKSAEDAANDEAVAKLPTPKKGGVLNWMKNNQGKTAVILAILALLILNGPKIFNHYFPPKAVTPPVATQPAPEPKVTPGPSTQPDAGVAPDAGSNKPVNPAPPADKGHKKPGNGGGKKAGGFDGTKNWNDLLNEP